MEQPELPSEEHIRSILGTVMDPELGSDIVSLGMVRKVSVDASGKVRIGVALTTAGCPLRAEIQRDVRNRVGSLPGVSGVKIDWSELTQAEKAETMARARRAISERPETTTVPARTKVLLVASGKGGVGKSSVSVNLAASLAVSGLRVGILDADIWGFSVPRMLGVEERLSTDGRGRILPQRVDVGEGSIEVVSMGLLVEEEGSALMWRGLILNRAVRHFLEDVAWGDLDYLVVDMPPGTGDVQMGLAKMLPRSEMLVVTTPALAAQKVAQRVVDMGRKNFLHVAGVIENMSAYVDPAGGVHEIFGAGGGERLAQEAGLELLGSIPIEPEVARGGDTGAPRRSATGPPPRPSRPWRRGCGRWRHPPTSHSARPAASCPVRPLARARRSRSADRTRRSGLAGACLVDLRGRSAPPRISGGGVVAHLGRHDHDRPRAAGHERHHQRSQQRARRGEQEHQAERVRDEARGEQQRPAEEGERSVEQLARRHPPGAQFVVGAPPDGRTLTANQPGAGDRHGDQREEGPAESDGVRRGDDHRQLRERKCHEQRYEDQCHATDRRGALPGRDRGLGGGLEHHAALGLVEPAPDAMWLRDLE
ncbi:MAG: P-loop NTPase [Microthrixaceae bacterium]